jgi:hypothetical protein
MSHTLNKSAKQVGLVVALAASIGCSFAASAEKLSFNQLVAYNMAQTMAELKFELNAELEQSTYEIAMGNMSKEMTVEGRRPVIKISRVEAEQAEE